MKIDKDFEKYEVYDDDRDDENHRREQERVKLDKFRKKNPGIKIKHSSK